MGIGMLQTRAASTLPTASPLEFRSSTRLVSNQSLNAGASESTKSWEWKDECSLGIPAIDLQHKSIFDCISRIAQGAADDDKLRAEAEIIKLPDLLLEHFLIEESLMKKLYYPDLEQHIEEHRQFHYDVRHLAQRSLRKKGGVPREALGIAYNWLTEHIMLSDKHYFEFFLNPIQKSRGRKSVAK